ncbi:MAG: hypothetical protein RL755_40 [Pseudomonadota bacterium]|jgi:hypothetical protein
MNKSDEIKELATALAKYHATAVNPAKNATNPHLKSKYADLSEVINASRGLLASVGLSIVQLESFANDCATVETILLHESGQFISSTLSIPCAKKDAQGIGSVMTYARRYGWSAMCGLAQEDDDGNAVSKTQQPVAPVEKEIYTFERADENIANWVNANADLNKLFTGISSKYQLYGDVKQYIAARVKIDTLSKKALSENTVIDSNAANAIYDDVTHQSAKDRLLPLVAALLGG